MYASRQNFRAREEIRVEEHNDNVILDRQWKYGRFVHVQCIRP